MWLYCVGFVLTFAPLFVKLWRVKAIFHNKSMSKLKISSSKLFGMILSVLLVDSVVALLWMYNDPLVYVRAATSTNSLGANTESVGQCESNDAWAYLGWIVAFHVALLISGNVVAYQGRTIPTAFSESKYVSIAMLSNLQVFALGVPVLLIMGDNPNASFFVRCGIIFLNNLTVLCLIFAPKVLAEYFPRKFGGLASTQISSPASTARFGSANRSSVSENSNSENKSRATSSVAPDA